MKTKLLLGLLILLSSCNRYVINSIDTKLGIKLSSRNLKVCKGTNIEKYNGKPVGNNWHRAYEIQGIELEKDDLYKPIINENIFQILKDDKQKEYCHKVDIYNSDLNARKADEKIASLDYIFENPNSLSLSEIFSEIAITKAVEKLEASASANQIKLPVTFYANFKNELRKELTTNSTSNAQLRYIIIDVQGIDLNSNENSLSIQAMIQAGLKAVLDEYKTGKKIITGISGFSITDFSSDTKIVQDNSMITAIDAAAKGESSELLANIEKIKVTASVDWSKSINQKIQTEINVKGCSFFYPLWIKYSSITPISEKK